MKMSRSWKRAEEARDESPLANATSSGTPARRLLDVRAGQEAADDDALNDLGAADLRRGRVWQRRGSRGPG